MRFIGLFVSMLVAVVLVIAAGWFIYDHARVWWVGRELASEYLKIKRLANQKPDWYLKECSEFSAETKFEPSQLNQPAVAGYQLRFIDGIHYVIEVVCTDKRIKSVVIRTDSLTWGVKKTAGSGVMVPVIDQHLPDSPKAHPLDSRVVLQAGKVYRAVGFYQDKLINKLTWATDRNVGADLAITECLGWGYDCCNQATQVGQGEVQTKTVDCPNQCYPACLERPSVVFFNTDPPIDGSTREVWLNGTEIPVRFGYELIDLDGEVRAAKIDYGDGISEGLNELKGIVVHVYQCLSEKCEYTAKISLTDDMGLPMVESRIAEVAIKITR